MSPPLLQKMNERQVGDIVVYNRRIIEPKTGCAIAYGFPSNDAAEAAAKEMNDVADWIGIVKTRAQNGRPNCQDELERIAVAHGGKLGVRDGERSAARCSAAVEKLKL